MSTDIYSPTPHGTHADGAAAPVPTPGPARRRRRWFLTRPAVLPGFPQTLGFAVFYVSLVVLLPITALVLKSATLSWHDFWVTISSARAIAAFRLSFFASLAAALINGVFGMIVAWVLVRYRFPGKTFIDAVVDLPFALPTAVAGIALTSLYAPNGWIGQWFAKIGVKVAFTPLGIIVALTFVGLPFVVRTVQPVLEDIDAEIEEAAAALGASRLQTFQRVLFPAILPALVTGATLSFARAVGEYGSVVFISGNMPLKTEIAPLLIVTKLEQYEYAEATAVAVVMLAASFVLLFALNAVQAWSRRRSQR